VQNYHAGLYLCLSLGPLVPFVFQAWNCNRFFLDYDSFSDIFLDARGYINQNSIIYIFKLAKMKHPAALRSFSLSRSSFADPRFPCLHLGLLKGDNYGYFLQTDPQSVLAVDVPEGHRMLEILAERGWRLEALLLTHTHHDHVVYLQDLLDATGCAFFYPQAAGGLPTGTALSDGSAFELGGLRVEVLDTSGHSDLDFSYWFPDLNLCFCGDSLFAWGCGRMFAGPPERFWHSLCRLRDLPPETRLCCGHDYAVDNRLFLQKTFPGRPLPAESDGEMPLLLKTQQAENPFLRADDPAIAAALDLKDADPVLVFKSLRELRNQL
jgi:hydroxyacylglutathione hydrolase